jgi:two-component system, chemotaxis family, chemotaxis protein CheY
MIGLDDEIGEAYLAASCEHMATAEAGLLALEQSGEPVNEEWIDRVFRSVHKVKAGAGLFHLVKIRELAQRVEDVLSLIRTRKMVPAAATVSVLLRATDSLREMLQNPGTSNQVDNSGLMAALDGLSADGPERQGRSPHLRMLLVEDDFASRLLLQTFLSRHGECHVAVNGKEAVEAFRHASEQGQPYDLICMDIMMPEMDGTEAVRQVRAMEEARGILSTHGSKIVMTTTVRDIREVGLCFRELCDAYLLKPIDLAELISQMKTLGLLSEPHPI